MATVGAPGRGVELWMVSNFAVGAGFAAFVSLLIPPYVTETTGSASDAGVVMAMISLAAVLGPVLGSFADRYRAHRLVLCSGVFGMAMAFALYALSSHDSQVLALDALLMGVAIAAQQALAPVFVVAAGLPQDLEARRLTVLNVSYPVGQVVGGALLGAAAAAGWSYSDRFWMAAVFMAVAGVPTVLGTRGPASRIQVVPREELAGTGRKGRSSLGSVFRSLFGVYLLVLVLSSIASNGINNQIANILPNVYGISQVTTSTLISVAGVLNIVLFFVAGAWMARKGAIDVFTAGTVMRFGGALALALLGTTTGQPVLLVAAAMQLLYQGSPFTRLAQSPVGMGATSLAPGATNGWILGASATGSFVGSVLGGYLAAEVGFNAISWMGAAAAGLAVALILVSLRPAMRDRVRAAAGGGEP